MIDTWTISTRGEWEITTPAGTVYTREDHDEALELATSLATIRAKLFADPGKYAVRKAKES